MFFEVILFDSLYQDILKYLKFYFYVTWSPWKQMVTIGYQGWICLSNRIHVFFSHHLKVNSER